MNFWETLQVLGKPLLKKGCLLKIVLCTYFSFKIENFCVWSNKIRMHLKVIKKILFYHIIKLKKICFFNFVHIFILCLREEKERENMNRVILYILFSAKFYLDWVISFQDWVISCLDRVIFHPGKGLILDP